ncbi:hypothetical protein GCM10007301_11100 [Azorhizobium oxalatiphilum]|uniref:DUF58 domain-containing protein n=1 Tax=Azorhizobium oxalatiphilum TaxID=980631 RepID=A0A917F683_9HYPH|nr:DUF58 domain-containing protein [Azorhizobium oxalatiphilum]GGF53432.1 hypothetical protein GCM10007301_11100 [Azorhizobium oxalatiphilum]
MPNPDFASSDFYGLVARLDELIAVRPGGRDGFASRGRVKTQQNGGYRSPFKGRGMEFDEVRAYQPGDDIRTIDWRVTARTGRTHTKLFQEERERPVLILMDARSFMRFGTRDTFKSVLAAKAAAVLAWTSMDGGDRVGGVVLSPTGAHAFPPQRARSRVLGFVRAVAEATQDGFGREPMAGSEPPLAEAIGRLRLVSRPGTLVFIVSDFHDFDAAAARELNRLSLHAHVTNVFIYDALEAHTPAHGAYPVSDGSAVAMLDADSEAVRAAYARRFAARRHMVAALARQRGMGFVPIRTGEDPADLLHPERLARRPKGASA